MWEGPSYLWADDPGCTQKQVEQVMGSKPVRSIPPSSVLQLVSPRSFSDFLRYGLPWMFKWNKPICSPSCFWSVCSITSKGNLRQCGTMFKKNNRGKKCTKCWSFSERVRGAEKMAQSVKCFQCKHEDQRSDPKHAQKIWAWQGIPVTTADPRVYWLARLDKISSSRFYLVSNYNIKLKTNKIS